MRSRQRYLMTCFNTRGTTKLIWRNSSTRCLWDEKHKKHFFDSWRTTSLLTLDGSVDVTDKKQSCPEAYRPKHEEETIADTCHVTEEEWCLHKARHIWACVVVIQTVGIDKYASRRTTEKRSVIKTKQIHQSRNNITSSEIIK